MARARPTRILSIDGGGIRGLIPAIWLHRLQGMLRRPLPEYFDLIAGTSTGSILAAALGSGRTTDDIVRLYQDHASDVFPPQFGRIIGEVRHAFTSASTPARYSSEGLDRVLGRVFGEAALGDLPRPTLITAYDPEHDRPVTFDSRDPASAGLSLRDVCLASSALPGIFPPHVMTVGDRGELTLVDGGEYDRNPTCQALSAEIVRSGLPAGGFLVASLGTGISTEPSDRDRRREVPADAVDLSWALSRLTGLLDRDPPEGLDATLRASVFHRFQVTLSPELARPDQAGRDQIRGLLNAAVRYLSGEDGERRLAELAAALDPDSPSGPAAADA